MPEQEYDPWATTSGLPIDGVTATVSNVEFMLNHEIGPNVVVARFTLVTDDGQEVTQDFSVGSNHKPNRDGDELENRAPFSDNSNFGRLVNSAKEVVPDIRSVIPEPRIAANWIGTKWTFGMVEVETGRPGSTERVKRKRPVFVEYHGKGGGGVASTGAPTTTKKSAPEPTDIDPELWDKLVNIANTADDYSDYIGKALDLPEIDGDAALQKRVTGSGKGTPWAARAKS